MVPPQFGKCVPGESYCERPGAYGIAIDQQGRVLVVAVGDLLALPGGGLEQGEPSEDGLKREFREETGYDIRILAELGLAGQYVYARQEDTYYNKLCRFYRVDLIGCQRNAQEDDHLPHWLLLEAVASQLTEEAHRWALRRAMVG